jgi:hypothetical protein
VALPQNHEFHLIFAELEFAPGGRS